jgi:hypothetical protein
MKQVRRRGRANPRWGNGEEARRRTTRPHRPPPQTLAGLSREWIKMEGSGEKETTGGGGGDI